MILFCLGFSCGAAALWAHFKFSGLIRTREEWEDAERVARGKNPS